jgi:hypothetical protein
VAYYSRKLNSAQRNYATIDKNILSVGNLSEQQLCCISDVDEYCPTIHYVEGSRNVIAETFSRLLRKDSPSTLVGKKVAHVLATLN